MGSQQDAQARRNAQLVRLLRVLRDLDRLGGIDLYELAQRHDADVRTIRRDLAALQSAGLPLVQEPAGKRKRWRVAYKDKLAKVSSLLDAGHYLALRVAMGQVGALRQEGVPFADLEDLAKKIEDALGGSEHADARAIDACFHSYEKFAYQRAAPDVLWPLVHAIANRRLCSVTYRAPRAAASDKSFEILPLRLFVFEGAVYLMCHVPKHNSVTTLNLQRLKELGVLDSTGEPPAGFDPSQMENAAFGVFVGGEATRYVLRFDRDAAPFIRERVWHPTQAMTDRRGGGVELTFTCGASPEVLYWVASWREHVKVIEPASLRTELGELGEWLVDTYARPAKPRAKRKVTGRVRNGR